MPKKRRCVIGSDCWQLAGVKKNEIVEDTVYRGYIAQWSERLTADQQVPDSNPGVP